MSATHLPFARRRIGLVGLWFALVALAVQLTATVVLPSVASATSFDALAAASICHAGGSDAPVPHHRHDCAVCPLCQAIGHSGALLAPAVVALAGPTFVVMRLATLPFGRAPPPARPNAPVARGPPLPV